MMCHDCEEENKGRLSGFRKKIESLFHIIEVAIKNVSDHK